MILVLRQHASEADVERVLGRVRDLGAEGRVTASGERTFVALSGVSVQAVQAALMRDPSVDLLVPTATPEEPVTSPPPPAGLEICLGPAQAVVGGTRLGIIAGPCSVENKPQILEIAHAVQEAGAIGLRGGAFKPRTNPYSFQGLGERALGFLAEAREETGLAIVTEVMSVDQVDLVARYADVLQIGTRSMHNFNLLSAAGRSGKPILLKRGWSASLDEFLHAAEYILNEGNENVILCERGIRTFETYVRNTLALAVVPAVKQRSRFPIIVDPSHGTGSAALVAPMSRAAIACGADGLLVEVHPQPDRALTDGDQALDITQFQTLISELKALAPIVGRQL